MASLKAVCMLVLIGASLYGGLAYADPVAVSKNAGEDDASFVRRMTKQNIDADNAGHNQIANTSKLIKNAETLVAFTDAVNLAESVPANAPDYDITLNAFLKKPDGSYTWIGHTVACEIEGGSASLRAFFYAGLDNAAAPDVGVVCGWDESHASDCGAPDEVRFFKVNGNSISAVPMEKYQKILYRQSKPDKDTGFTCTVAKFKNAGDVKRLLKARH